MQNKIFFSNKKLSRILTVTYPPFLYVSSSFLGLGAWTNRHQGKMSSSKKTDLERDFAVGVYQSLKTGDTVSHVGIFGISTQRTIAPLLFYLVLLSHPPPHPCVKKYTAYTYTVCKGGMKFWASDRYTKSHYR